MGDAHCLTDETKSYLSYSSFEVGPAFSNYQLNISGYEGITSSDPFISQNGMHFTTKDKDNDKWSGINCAIKGGNPGGW